MSWRCMLALHADHGVRAVGHSVGGTVQLHCSRESQSESQSNPRPRLLLLLRLHTQAGTARITISARGRSAHSPTCSTSRGCSASNGWRGAGMAANLTHTRARMHARTHARTTPMGRRRWCRRDSARLTWSCTWSSTLRVKAYGTEGHYRSAVLCTRLGPQARSQCAPLAGHPDLVGAHGGLVNEYTGGGRGGCAAARLELAHLSLRPS